MVSFAMEKSEFLKYVADGDRVMASRLAKLLCNYTSTVAAATVSKILNSSSFSEFQPFPKAGDNKTILLDKQATAKFITKLPDGTHGGKSPNAAGRIRRKAEQFLACYFEGSSKDRKKALSELSASEQQSAKSCHRGCSAGEMVWNLLQWEGGQVHKPIARKAESGTSQEPT